MPFEAARRDRLFPIAFALAFVAALVPLWWPRFYPYYDFPNHLAGIGIWSRLIEIPDPSWRYAEFYEGSLVPIPYWGYYYPVVLLSRFFSIEVANKLYLSAYALALPLSLIVLGRRFGRSAWLSLFAFPFIFNYSFGFGFFGYCGGMAMLFFSLALTDAALARPTPARLLGLFLLSLADYFTHVFPWFLLGVFTPLFLLTKPVPWKARARVAAALLPSALVALANWHYAAAHGIYHVTNGPFATTGRPERLVDAIKLLPHRFLIGWPGPGDESTLVALGVSALLIGITARLRGEREPRTMHRHLPLLFATVALAGYLLLPYRLEKPLDWWNVSWRLLLPAALLGALALPGPLRGRFRLLLLPAFLACLYYPVALAARLHDFNTRVAGMARLMALVPRGSSTLVLGWPPFSDPAVDAQLTPYLTLHSYAQFLGGGYDPYQYRNGFPFKLLPGKQRPAPFFTHPEELTPAEANHYDYLLTHQEPARPDALGGAAFHLIAADGTFRLYRHD